MAQSTVATYLLERLKQFPDIGSVGLAVSMPNRQASGWVFEHVVVMSRHLERPLKEGPSCPSTTSMN